MDLVLHLDPGPHAPGEARRGVERLAAHVDPDLLQELRLVVTELVANAVVHGPGKEPVTVKLVVDASGNVRGEVEDQGDGVVEIRESAGEGGGYGLRLLDRMADRWGVYEGSTHVWFELSSPG